MRKCGGGGPHEQAANRVGQHEGARQVIRRAETGMPGSAPAITMPQVDMLRHMMMIVAH